MTMYKIIIGSLRHSVNSRRDFPIIQHLKHLKQNALKRVLVINIVLLRSVDKRQTFGTSLVLVQLSCWDIWQIWMWFNVYSLYVCLSEFPIYGFRNHHSKL